MATKLKQLKLNELSLVDYPANKSAAVTIFKRKENDMDTITKKEHDELIAKLNGDWQKKLDELTAKVEKALKDNEELTVIAKMSDDEREYCSDMSADEKKKFAGMSAEERKKKMGVKKADESVVVAGVTIYKSKVGEGTFEVLKAQQKQLDDQKQALEKANDEAETAKVEKRVDAEFKNVVGKTADKAKLFRHVAKGGKEIVDVFETIMKSCEQLVARGFETMGHGNGKGEISKAGRTFLAKVSEIQARDKISKHAAMSKARTEFPEEFKAYQEEGAAE